MIRIYITNLGKYTEGELVGEWFNVLDGEDELQEVLERIGINERYEEYFITDFESDLEHLHIGENDSIQDLIYYSDMIRNLTEGELKVLDAIIFTTNDDFGTCVNTFIHGRCSYYEGIKNNTHLGMALLQDDDIPEYLSGYINYDAYGRDSDYVIVDNGIAIYTY